MDVWLRLKKRAASCAKACGRHHSAGYRVLPQARFIHHHTTQASAAVKSSSPVETSAQSLAIRLARCPDLASIHALLLEQTRIAQAGAGYASSLATWTRPGDAVVAFSQLATRWLGSAQRPLDAATLSDALQYAYTLLNVHMATLSPRETASILISLSGLRSASPEVLRQLADALMRKPASSPHPQGPPSTSPPPGSTIATAAAASSSAQPLEALSDIPRPHLQQQQHPPSTSPSQQPSQPVPSSAPGLSRLPSQELAQVVSALAAFNVRPGDSWLGACMGSLQLGLPYLSGPQLAQLLWALVQLGVRPTSPWLALFEEAISACLERHLAAATKPGLDVADAAKPGERVDPGLGRGGNAADGGSAAAAAVSAASVASVPPAAATSRSRNDGVGNPAPEGRGQPARAPYGGEELLLSCEDLIRLVRAAAEVGFQPEERCRGLLLAASGAALRDMQPHQVASLAWAVSRLRWRVDEAWRREFVQVTRALLPQLKAADLPPVLAFVAAARLDPGPSWLWSCLQASYSHLPQASPRDLPDLLMDLVLLDEKTFKRAAAAAADADADATATMMTTATAPAGAATATAARRPSGGGGVGGSGGGDGGGFGGQGLHTGQEVAGVALEASTSTPVPSAAASVMASSATAPLRVDDRLRDQEELEEVVALATAWLQRYLQQCKDKLSRFTAGGLARMMLAVARIGMQPDEAWRQAACAALASKSDVLGPTDLADAVIALAALRQSPAPPPPPPPPPQPSPTSGGQLPGQMTPPLATSHLVPAHSQLRLRPSATARQPQSQRPLNGQSSRHVAAISARVGVGLPAASHVARTPPTSVPPPSPSSPSAGSVPSASSSPQSQLLEALLSACVTKLSLLPDDRLVHLATAVAALDSCRPAPALLRALLEETQTRLEATAVAAAAAAPAVASQQRSPGAGPAARRPPPPPPLTPRLLSELLVAVAKLDGLTLPGRWLGAFLRAAELQLGEFDAAALGGLLWGLVVLEVRPPEPWVRRVLARAQACMPPTAAAAAAAGVAVDGAGGGGVTGMMVAMRGGVKGPRRRRSSEGVIRQTEEGAGGVRELSGSRRVGAAQAKGLVGVVAEDAAGASVSAGCREGSREEGIGGRATERSERSEDPAGEEGKGDGPSAEGSALGAPRQRQSRRRGPRQPSCGYLSGPYRAVRSYSHGVAGAVVPRG